MITKLNLQEFIKFYRFITENTKGMEITPVKMFLLYVLFVRKDIIWIAYAKWTGRLLFKKQKNGEMQTTSPPKWARKALEKHSTRLTERTEVTREDLDELQCVVVQFLRQTENSISL
jgi:hypothetical protein